MSDNMTVHDAACKLNCSEETVRRMIRSGRLPALQLQRDYRISKEDIALSLNSGKIKK